jgi:hypothetical protein
MKQVFSFGPWLLLLSSLSVACFSAHAQNVGIGTLTPDASAMLEIASSSGGVLLPRLTSAQRLGIAAPATGLLVYQTDGAAGFYYNAGTATVPNWTLLNPTPTGAGDNLGNHTATQALNLQGNALIGTGATIGTAVGVGIRADGGLNLGQNNGGNIFLGYQSGQATIPSSVPLVRSNIFIGYQSGASNTTGYQNVFEGYQSGNANTTGFQNQFTGFGSGQFNTIGNNNYFSGYYSGHFNTTGTNNLFIGVNSGVSTTTASNNMFVGNLSGYYNTTGDQNLFMGLNSGYRNTTGRNNYFTGARSGFENTTGSFNQFSGFESGDANTTGSNNHFDGYQSGGSNTTGANNLFVGLQSGLYNTTGSNNHFVGYQSGNANTTGLNNQFDGYQSGLYTISGSNNQFSGYQSGYFNTIGNFNAFLGYQSGYNNITGSNNLFVGVYSGYATTTGSNNTAVGYGAGPTGATLTNTTAVGYTATVSQNNSLVLGGTGANAVSVGIGTTAPSATLHVAGANSTLRLEGLAGAGARIVTAAANGTLGTSTAASLDPTTASNGLTKTGTNTVLGGTLGQATAIAQAGYPLGFTGGSFGIGTVAPTATLHVSGAASTVRLEGLAGTGARIVTAAANGTLGTSTAASLDPTIASNGLTKVNNTFSLGGTLSQATTIDQATNPLGLLGGSVGIGTAAPAATLDVAGSAKLGTTGTPINALMRLTTTFDMSPVPAAGTGTITVAVPNALLGASVSVNPTAALPDGLGIAYAYVSAPGSVIIRFINATNAAIDPPSLDYALLVVQ